MKEGSSWQVISHHGTSVGMYCDNYSLVVQSIHPSALGLDEGSPISWLSIKELALRIPLTSQHVLHLHQQGAMESALSMLTREDRVVLGVCGAGRTDSGVHAAGQVCDVLHSTEGTTRLQAPLWKVIAL